MSREFEDFMKELDQEARRGGPKAIAELAAFDAHHRLAREAFDLRKLRGMTQRQLALKSGLQQAEISRIEAGNSNPTLSTIAALAQALGAELSLKRTRASRSATRARSAGRRLAPARAAARRTP
jgi:transcriptional regulator with XRE-family HTH domain